MLLSIAVAPAVFLLLFVYLRDKYEREPLSLIAITFVIGAAFLLRISIVSLDGISSQEKRHFYSAPCSIA